MRLQGATRNVEFLCAMMYAKESRLLSKSQLQLLKSLSSYDELLSVLSGTVFHRFVSEKKGLSEIIYYLEQGSGIEARNFFKIEPDLMLLSVVDRVSEAFKILALGKNGSISKERVFLCGLKAGELLNPESLPLPPDSVSRDVLIRFKESMQVSQNPFDLDLNMYVSKKKARHLLAERFGKEVKSLVKKMDFISDVFNVLSWIRFRTVDIELIFEHRIYEYLDERIKNAIIEYRKNGDFESFSERIFLDRSYRIVKDFFNGTDSLEALYSTWKASIGRLLVAPSYGLLTPAYPVVFMHRFYEQVENIKRAILNIENSVRKNVKEVASRT